MSQLFLACESSILLFDTQQTVHRQQTIKVNNPLSASVNQDDEPVQRDDYDQYKDRYIWSH